ncbi:hypothetical protein LV475_05865 [Guyparkeria hydrothermalis]|uniref:hypothetical protein n=1 Tax=Guyparkeria TaxID=2035712 RepID=UPI0010AD7917|nr:MULTISPECIES: hypothetical protein [Guyparkeria]MCL7751118.1 hypothetical protein [Guyparkeria hydrothermalis]TKA89931.1 hypothetical protein FAZ79_04465 [Guyparkeria sp. SB14A]
MAPIARPAHHWRFGLLLLLAAAGTPLAAPTVATEHELPAGIDEASGLTLSVQHERLLWTHNDNINDPGSSERVTPRVHGIDPEGRQRLSLELEGLVQRDWEAIESIRLDDSSSLVVADTGDNRDSWPDYVLWFVDEPAELPPSAQEQRTTPSHLLRFRYPDGSADTEAMVVDRRGGQILLLTKREDPPRLFSLPLAARQPFAEEGSPRQRLERATVHEARLIGPMGGLVPTDPINWLLSPLTGRQTSLPTGMTLSSDNRLLAVLTYSSLYFFRRDVGERWAEAIRRPVASRSLPRIDQWEGIAFDREARSLTIVREGTGAGTLLHLEVPEAARVAATPRSADARGRD